MQEFFVLLESEFINLTNGFKGEVPDDLLALERNEQLSLNCDRFSEILNKILENNRSSEIENGMNTFGILLDRITILKCKSKFSQDETSRFVAEGQLARIIISLENCGRGDAELLKKEQVEQHLGGFSSHGQALITLLRSNIAMWLNQDLLYTKMLIPLK